MFKSYYVVWKRLVRPEISPTSFTFKSYYVVWKRATAPTDTHYANSLNRTM